MAIIVPVQPEWANQAERQVAESILLTLPADAVMYVHRYVEAKETDLILFLPNQGFVIVEIKDWRASKLRVVDGNKVLYQTDNGDIPLPSPIHQVNGYRWALIKSLKKHGLTGNVVPIVYYPFITRAEFSQERLDLLTPPEMSACNDELIDPDQFVTLTTQLFDLFGNHTYTYSEEEVFRVRLIFETEDQIRRHTEQQHAAILNDDIIDVQKTHTVRGYSALAFTNQVNQVEELVKGWAAGCKTTIVTNEDAVLDAAFTALEQQVKELHLNNHKAFKTRDKNNNPQYEMFLLQLLKATTPVTELVIHDGNQQQIEDNILLIQEVVAETGFNFEQYRLEHAPIHKDIIVRAGAGTGKTYSMISRINYLIFAHQWDADALAKSLIMITFTNDSADTMKQRLQENLQNYFLLTRNVKYMTMLEKLENIKITTIHSFAKALLKKYSWKLGLGRDMTVVTYQYESRQILEQCVNEYIRTNVGSSPDDMRILGMDMYLLLDRLRQITERVQGRNIDLLRDHVDFGEAKNVQLNGLIAMALPETERRIRERLAKENKIRVNDLMLKLKELIAILGRESLLDNIQYIFVDEFQDTDNVQIDLIKIIKESCNCSLFVVGDVKQCIYRFRGAQEQAFERLTGQDLHWGLHFSLKRNYRTDTYLLQWFEQIFGQWIDMPHGKLLPYEPGRDSLVGVKVYNSQTAPGLTTIQVNDDSEFEEKFIEILRSQRDGLEKGGSLAILVRENWEINAIRKVGQKHRIYIHSDVGGGLFQIEPALDLYRLVLAMQYPNNPKFLFNLYQTYYISEPLPLTQVMKYRKQKDKLLEVFTQEQGEKWNEWAKTLEREPVLKVLREIITSRQPWICYRETFDTGEDQREAEDFYKRNLEQLYEQLFSVGQTDYLTINKLAKYLEIMIVTGRNQETRQQRQDSKDKGRKIYCTTVHKAKGLEYDTVILVNGTRNIERINEKGAVDVIVVQDKKSKGFQVGYSLSNSNENRFSRIHNKYYIEDREAEKFEKMCEETRILYVALTRAKKQLIYFDRPVKGTGLTWQGLLGVYNSYGD